MLIPLKFHLETESHTRTQTTQLRTQHNVCMAYASPSGNGRYNQRISAKIKLWLNRELIFKFQFSVINHFNYNAICMGNKFQNLVHGPERYSFSFFIFNHSRFEIWMTSKDISHYYHTGCRLGFWGWRRNRLGARGIYRNRKRLDMIAIWRFRLVCPVECNAKRHHHNRNTQSPSRT